MAENKVNKSNLGYLGIDFQYRLIASFFNDQGFFSDLNTIIDQNMFTDQYLRSIVSIIKEYFLKYGSVPNYEMLQIKINEKGLSEDDMQYYAETIEKLKKAPIEGYKEIEDMAMKFFKQQNIIKVANKLKTTAADGDISKYEECQRILEDALAIGRHLDDDEWHPFDSLDDDLSKEAVTTIPTGIDKLDEVLGGGLDKGKIGLIICPSGKGKTSLTTCFAGNAAICKTEQNDYQGFKVLQIVFEDRKRDMNRKVISKVTQVETRKINSSTEQENAIREMIANFPDRDLMNQNLLMKKLPTGEYTATDIKEIIKKKINQGYYPDLVIVDYLECIKPEPGTSKDDITEREGTTIRKFETMADELNIAMWLPSQGNRASMTSEVVTEDQIGGSIRKVQVAQVILSIARDTNDMKNNRATIAVLKNRSGAVNTFNGIYFNNGTCTVNTESVIEFDDALSYNEYAREKDAETERNLIRQAAEQQKNLRKG